MLEDLIYSISTAFTHSTDLGALPAETLPLSSFFSGAGALILGKFTGSLGGLTLPINFSALFIGATLSNWLLTGLDLQIDREIQQPMFVSMLGMVIAAFAMMYWIQNDRARI
ncbi:MAG: hypothetical protein KDK89_11800 [Alphaproteobacteria bacterium]|nr:hypothetical protein [Alphaproteobacteria bacterium]